MPTTNRWLATLNRTLRNKKNDDKSMREILKIAKQNYTHKKKEKKQLKRREKKRRRSRNTHIHTKCIRKAIKKCSRHRHRGRRR